MKELIIKHPLRDIILHYDELKPECEAEKGIIAAHIALHDQVYEVSTTANKLRYEYKELEDMEEIAPITHFLNGMFAEANYLKGTHEREILDEFQNRFTNYHPTLLNFHENIVNPLTAEQKRLDEVYYKFEDAKELVYKGFSNFRKLMSAGLKDMNYENFSLDIVAFDTEEEELKEASHKTRLLDDERGKEIDFYNLFIDGHQNKTYTLWDDIKLVMSNIYDDTGEMDSSISESYANGTGDPTKRPYYLLQPGDKKVKDFRKNYGLMANSESKSINISVTKDIVLNGNTAWIMELIHCLQHYPKLIEKMLFTFDLTFTDDDGTVVPEDRWKGTDEPIKWLTDLRNFPCAVFFFSDRDVRAYIIMGDLMMNKVATVVDAKTISLEGEPVNELCNRIYHASWFFMVFCHNTGFDPKIYIESYLADFDLPVTYEMVKEQFDKDIAQGLQIHAIPMKENGGPADSE